LAIDALVRFGDGQLGGNPRAGSFDGPKRAPQRHFAAGGDQHRRAVRIGKIVMLGGNRVHEIAPIATNRTEPLTDNPHFGEKSDDFGSRSDHFFCATTKRAYKVVSKGVAVARVSTDVTATQRARWLRDISDALEEAQDLVWQLAIAEARDVDALDLSARIEAARAEARSMCVSRVDRSSVQTDPKWSVLLPWARQLEGSA
jgi:hypothetical protein